MRQTLQPFSFIHNDGDGRTRYGFIAENTTTVDAHLATYNASGTVSGIDDRSILAVLIGAIKDLASKISEIAHLVIDMLTARRVETTELCVDDVCVTRDQFAEVFGNKSAAAGASIEAVPQEAPASQPAPGLDRNAGTATSTTPSDSEPITFQASERGSA